LKSLAFSAGFKPVSSLWKSGDGNCCPTAGRATLRLGIKNGRLVILDLHVRNGQAAAQEN
jgi:hypothetical protein